MGTRADYYVGRGEQAEWLGSTAWDGYPSGIESVVLSATSETAFREAVSAMLAGRDDATLPEEGWPWPWEDSHTTDYAYAFDGGLVWVTGFGASWVQAATALERDGDDEGAEEDGDARGDEVVFPNMKNRQNVQWGRKSGLIIIEGGGIGG